MTMWLSFITFIILSQGQVAEEVYTSNQTFTTYQACMEAGARETQLRVAQGNVYGVVIECRRVTES